jgi:hypothetical protein
LGNIKRQYRRLKSLSRQERSERHPIKGVVQITTDLPSNCPAALFTPEVLPALNRSAALGALTIEKDRYFIGEQEEAWEVYLPFLLFTVIADGDPHMGALQT